MWGNWYYMIMLNNLKHNYSGEAGKSLSEKLSLRASCSAQTNRKFRLCLCSHINILHNIQLLPQVKNYYFKGTCNECTLLGFYEKNCYEAVGIKG